ncbi:MAG: hypothetical protein R2710_08050 [Acidimicrobiales bacterium]
MNDDPFARSPPNNQRSLLPHRPAPRLLVLPSTASGRSTPTARPDDSCGHHGCSCGGARADRRCY